MKTTYGNNVISFFIADKVIEKLMCTQETTIMGREWLKMYEFSLHLFQP